MSLALGRPGCAEPPRASEAAGLCEQLLEALAERFAGRLRAEVQRASAEQATAWAGELQLLRQDVTELCQRLSRRSRRARMPAAAQRNGAPQLGPRDWMDELKAPLAAERRAVPNGSGRRGPEPEGPEAEHEERSFYIGSDDNEEGCSNGELSEAMLEIRQLRRELECMRGQLARREQQLSDFSGQLSDLVHMGAGTVEKWQQLERVATWAKEAACEASAEWSAGFEGPLHAAKETVFTKLICEDRSARTAGDAATEMSAPEVEIPPGSAAEDRTVVPGAAREEAVGRSATEDEAAREEMLRARAAKEEEEARRKAAEELEARRKVAEEEEARRKAAEEEAAQRKAAEEQAAQRKAAEEEAARQKAAEEDAARQKALEEEAEQRKTAEVVAREEEEKAARRRAEEEEEARRKAEEEEEARRKAAEEAEEAQRKAAAEEAARRKAEEEAEVRRKEAEEAAARRTAEEARRKAEQEAARQKAEEEAERKRAEEAARRKAAEEEEARRKAAEEEHARKKALEEEERAKAAKEEAARQAAAEEAAALQKAESELRKSLIGELEEEAGQLWEVVGGAHTDGILVRMGQAISSPKIPERLSTGSVVKQVELDGDRLNYELVAGDGPGCGWVSVRLKDKSLLVRRRSGEEAAGAEAAGEESSLAAEEGKPEASQEPPGPYARLLLWPRNASRRAIKPARNIARVCVLGAHHTGTNALMKELQRFFSVQIVNEHRSDNPALWKHKVLPRMPAIKEDMFFVCLVKDPAFWIQSLARNPADGTFYDILPVRTVKNGPTLQLEELTPTHPSQLFERVWFDGDVYDSALQLWERTVRTYFNESILPSARTCVVRYEDFLYSFSSVVKALEARGLPPRADAPSVIEALQETAKDTTHPRSTRRNRPELLKYYADSTEQYKGLSKAQTLMIKKMDSRLITALGYGEAAPASWQALE